MKMLVVMLKFLRVHHWIKNLLVFVPTILTLRLFDMDCLLPSVYGFIIFSLSASAVYIVNDLRDLENDRRHPVKRNRPLPSGKVPVPAAYALLAAIFLCLCGMFLFLCLYAGGGYGILQCPRHISPSTLLTAWG